MNEQHQRQSAQRLVTTAAVVLGVILVAAPAKALDWTGFGGALPRLSDERAGAAFSPAWEHTLPGADLVSGSFDHKLLASPAAGDGFVVLGTPGGELRALREGDGKPLWQVGLRGAVTASPAIHRGRVFVVSESGELQALRLADGVRVWRRDLESLVFASPAIVNGLDGGLFVATGNPNPRVMRLDPEDGRVLWQTPAGALGQAAHAGLAFGPSELVVGEMNGTHHALALADGKLLWTAKLGGVVDLASPLVVGDTVFVLPGGATPTLHALARATGEELAGWPLPLPPVAAEPGVAAPTTETHVVSSLAGADGLLAFARRLDQQWDGNADGTPDRFVVREEVLFVDPAARAVTATVARGRLETTDVGAIPLFAFAPTPAGFRDGAGAPIWAVASSVDAQLRLFSGVPADAGKPLGAVALPAPGRSSPAFANGLLLVAGDAGKLLALAADANRPPVAPMMALVPTGGRAVDLRALVLRWGMAVDLEGGAPRYLVRVDDDGEVLHDWDAEILTNPGVQEAPLAGALVPNHLYTFAVRALDPAGAWSPWSYPSTFRAVVPPDVKIGEVAYASLDEALAHASPGQTVTLGRGTLPLDAPVRVPAGVTIAGAGPHLTTLDGTGLPTAVVPGAGAALAMLRVAGAEIGVSVEAPDVRLTNVILSDNAAAGLAVEPTGAASLVSATIARNGVGVRARGATLVRNTLATDNGVGIAASEAALASTSYCDVFANRMHDWEGAAPHATDLGAAVTFEPGEDPFMKPMPLQPSTDRGDPADDWTQEPQPNGGRINIGAYGNTPFAELSALDIPPPPDAGSTSDGGTDAGPVLAPEGCGCVLGATPRPAGVPLALLGLILAISFTRRRR